MKLPLLGFGLLWTVGLAGQDFTISTIAGGVPPPTPAVATAASIGAPWGMAADAAGNAYFSTSGHCVFKLAGGILTLVAGNSWPGYSGDGGAATSAQLNGPQGLALDGAGNLYIADVANNRVRRVSPAGIITTVAGTGEKGLSGDDGPATLARLSAPIGVAVDAAGNLYIADFGNNRVRRVSPAGVITSVAGTLGTFPFAIVVNPAGDVYLADYHVIRRVSPSGTITTVAGTGVQGFSGDGGPAVSAQLAGPSGLGVDSAGNLYIADAGNQRVRRVATSGIVALGIINTVAGNGAAGFSGDDGPGIWAQISNPRGVAVDGAGNLYIADLENNRVRRVNSGGVISTAAGNGVYQYAGDGGAATAAQLYSPYGVALDGAGNLYIADSSNYRVRRVSPAGVITTVAGTGVRGHSGDGGAATSARLEVPMGVAADGAGSVSLSEYGASYIRRVSLAGVITTVAGTGADGFSGDGGPAVAAQLYAPLGVALDAAGSLYIADRNNQRIRRVSASGIITTVAGSGARGYSGDSGAATAAQLKDPYAVAVDAAANLYIADSFNHRVRLVSPAGIITTVAGNGAEGFSGDGGAATSAQLAFPNGVAVDGAGNLYIADWGNHRIRRVSPSGIITSIAGTGVEGYSGDGGPALSAQLAKPTGIAVDAAGRVYLTTGHAVRMLTPVCASATPSALTAPAAGGPLALTIQGAGSCAWTIIGLPDWIAASATSGSGPSNVTLTTAANTGAARSVIITAAGTAVTISQAAAGGGACVYALSAASQRFTSAGGTGSFNVTTTAGCAWTAVSGLAWVAITSGAAGSGNGTVAFQVLANTSGTARSGAIAVAGLAFTVEQVAAGLAPVGSMAQVATGGGWRTIFTLMNNGAAAAIARLAFTSDAGTEFTLPLSLPQLGTGPTLASSIERTLNPGATLIVESQAPAAQPTQQGWAQLLSDGGVTGFAIFGQVGGATEPEAVVPLETRAAPGYLLAYDNTSGLDTGVAIANLASQAAAVRVIICDDAGAEIQTSPLNLAARGHTAFNLREQYPATARRRGTVEFRAPAGGEISVLGLRFNPRASFTTIPVVAK